MRRAAEFGIDLERAIGVVDGVGLANLAGVEALSEHADACLAAAAAGEIEIEIERGDQDKGEEERERERVRVRRGCG